MTCSRGANAEKNCFVCLNMKNKNSVQLAHDKSGFFVDHTEVDVSKLRFHTDDSVRTLHDRMRAQSAVLAESKFVELQMNYGSLTTAGLFTSSRRCL